MCGVDTTVDEGRLLSEWNSAAIFTFFNNRSSSAAPYHNTTVFEVVSLGPDGQVSSPANTSTTSTTTTTTPTTTTMTPSTNSSTKEPIKPAHKEGLYCLFVVPPAASCDSSALEAAAKGDDGFHPVFVGVSNNFSLPVAAFVAGAKCLRLEFGGEFPKLCGLMSSMIVTTATSRNEGFQGIYNFPYNNNRTLMPNKFKTCKTEEASRRAMQQSTFFDVADTYSFSKSEYSAMENIQECKLDVTRSQSSSKGIAFIDTVPGTADGGDFVPYSGPVFFDVGKSSIQFPISINDDKKEEPEETFQVSISSSAHRREKRTLKTSKQNTGCKSKDPECTNDSDCQGNKKLAKKGKTCIEGECTEECFDDITCFVNPNPRWNVCIDIWNGQKKCKECDGRGVYAGENEEERQAQRIIIETNNRQYYCTTAENSVCSIQNMCSPCQMDSHCDHRPERVCSTTGDVRGCTACNCITDARIKEAHKNKIDICPWLTRLKSQRYGIQDPIESFFIGRTGEARTHNRYSYSCTQDGADGKPQEGFCCPPEQPQKGCLLDTSELQNNYYENKHTQCDVVSTDGTISSHGFCYDPEDGQSGQRFFGVCKTAPCIENICCEEPRKSKCQNRECVLCIEHSDCDHVQDRPRCKEGGGCVECLERGDCTSHADFNCHENKCGKYITSKICNSCLNELCIYVHVSNYLYWCCLHARLKTVPYSIYQNYGSFLLVKIQEK